MKKTKTVIALLMLLCALLCALISCAVKEYDNDFYFRAGGVDIAPGMRTDDALGYLGEARGISSSPSCAFAGEEKIYSYSGYDIYALCENGREVIEKVVIRSDAVSTERGVRIGDTMRDVVVAYGRDYEKIGDNIAYEGERCDLQFFFEDGIVTSIRYLAHD